MKQKEDARTIELPFLRTAFNYDRNKASDETGINCQVDQVTGELTPSLTKQAFKDECDINVIVERFGLTGELPMGLKAPTYGDYTQVTDFQTAMNAIANANEAFDSLPAQVRARFHNDPQEFLEFCADEANRTEAEKLGLVMPKQVTQILDTPPVEKPTAPPPGGKETPKGVT